MTVQQTRYVIVPRGSVATTDEQSKVFFITTVHTCVIRV